jgi:putative hydrolase of the HAD superfamily
MLAADMSPADADENAKQAFAVFFAGRNDVAFYPNAITTLETLSQQYALYALTNGNADVERVGIGRFFSGAVSSADVGASKPDQQMFTTVLAKAGVPADRAVHIGDHLSDDVFGANRAGMRSIWFNYEGQASNDTDHKPTAQAYALAELPAVIASLDAAKTR